MIVDLFLSGQHWIRAAAFYLPVEEGRQGLIDTPSRVMAFRLQAAQRILYDCGRRWLEMAELLLRKAGCVGYSKQFFLCNFSEIDQTGLTQFYESVLQAWQVFRVTRDPTEIPGMWLFDEPLFFFIDS